MKNLLAAAAVLACFALIVAPAPLTAQDEITCDYMTNGLMGHLTISGGFAQPYMVEDSLGRPMAMGVCTSEQCLVAILGAAPGALRVTVGEQVLFATDRDGEWQ